MINRREQEEDQSPRWVGLATFLFIVCLTVVLYLLAKSMVDHHFFSGG